MGHRAHFVETDNSRSNSTCKAAHPLFSGIVLFRIFCFTAILTPLLLSGCSTDATTHQASSNDFEITVEEPREATTGMPKTADEEKDGQQGDEQQYVQTPDRPEDAPRASRVPQSSSADDAREALNITEDYRSSFVHGDKPARFQKYIVLHDTESNGDAQSVIDWWDSNGNLVAAHFVVNKDGSIWQCAPLDSIVHHAGFGDTGHNEKYGTTDESRDDKRGTAPIGDWAADYGMNSYSIGIEMVHVGGEGSYPKAQLEAVDKLIAYIDSYYGFESEIIDHKAWRSGNSDTSEEFAEHLKSYQRTRRHAS